MIMMTTMTTTMMMMMRRREGGQCYKRRRSTAGARASHCSWLAPAVNHLSCEPGKMIAIGNILAFAVIIAIVQIFMVSLDDIRHSSFWRCKEAWFWAYREKGQEDWFLKSLILGFGCHSISITLSNSSWFGAKLILHNLCCLVEHQLTLQRLNRKNSIEENRCCGLFCNFATPNSLGIKLGFNCNK